MADHLDAIYPEISKGIIEYALTIIEDEMSCLLFLAGIAAASGCAGDDDQAWFDAIRAVESDGNDLAVGDAGKSIGPYQISRAYWLDSKTSGAYSDCYDRQYAERVMICYWQRYCPQAWAARDWETLCRVHSGGPKGIEKEATKTYWQKVKGKHT